MPKSETVPKLVPSSCSGKVVLVGTYKGDTLTKWPMWYCYPVRAADKISDADAAKINELWLFKGTAEQKNYKAEFIGVKTREELVRDYGYPAKGKAHGERYLLFKKTLAYRIDDAPPEDAERVYVRTADFARTPKVRKQLKAYLESSDRADPDLAKRLPTIVTKVPRENLCVCEAAVQLNFLPKLDFIPSRALSSPRPAFKDPYPIIDLFAGCGGMSLGFELAGFHPVLAVEKDAWASETYASNHDGVNVVTNDIREITHPHREYPVGDVFGVVGGPPCQGFSLSGGRDPKDPRNSLFMDFMRFVKDFKPPFFVMENVPGILSSVTRMGEPVRDVILSEAKTIGYNVKVMLLDASHYGVPQSRHRVFFVGIRADYPFDPARLTPKATESSPVTIREALSDLPKIEAGGGTDSMAYATPPENDYQRWCRQGSSVVENHIAMRHTKRLVARFHVIRYGESAADVPEEHRQRKRGDAATISGKVYSQNNMRPFPDRPSPTVPASFQSNFVHPFFDRNYTAREGARLQSFPDSYVFRGRRTTMSWEKNLSQYQQIGNAVPPLLARALGMMIKDYFEGMKK